jgi:hypothetical protein
MDRNCVISNSKLIARTAAAMKDSNVPVGDEIWQSLIAMLPRAKTLAAHPSLLDDIALKPETTKTWVQVKHVAWSILDSMLGPGWAPAMDESEVRAYIRNAPDEGWQYPSGGQVFSRFNDDEYICRKLKSFSRDLPSRNCCVRTELIPKSLRVAATPMS